MRIGLKILLSISLVVILFFIHFLWRDDDFQIRTAVAGKIVYNYENTGLYVDENGKKKLLEITKGDIQCGVIEVKTNEKGIHALNVVTFGKYLDQYPFVERNFKSEFYVLFISEHLDEVNYEKMPVSIRDIEWVNDQLLKVVYLDEGKTVSKYIKNPF